MITPKAILSRILHKPSQSLVLSLSIKSVIPREARDPCHLRTAISFRGSFYTFPVLNHASPFRLLLLCLLLATVLLPAPGGNGHLAAASKPSKKEYALIFGTVWGPDDRPVYGVPVKIRRAQDKKPKWEVYSDHHGEFAQRVPPGEADYILSADLKGVKTADGKPLHQVGEVKVHIDYDEREDTGLHLAP